MLASVAVVGWYAGGRDQVVLRWTPPGACVEVYRVEIDETFRDPRVAAIQGRGEEHSRWLFALTGSDRVMAMLAPAGDLDLDADEVRVRELWWSEREFGPAAPDVVCRASTWDRFEDLVALAWPVLPAHPVRPGDSWLGADVEGRCHLTTCVDDETGRFDHARPCRAAPMRETLVDPDHVHGEWTDGATGDEIGILTSRLVELDAGRPVRVDVRVVQRWQGVVRELHLQAIDDCRGRSLDPDSRGQVEAIRARLRAESGT